MDKKCVFYVRLQTVFSHFNGLPSGLSKGFFEGDDQRDPAESFFKPVDIYVRTFYFQ